MANDIKLQEGHPVDENLRPLKVGGKSTAIETAQHGNGAKVNGDFEATGETKGITASQISFPAFFRFNGNDGVYFNRNNLVSASILYGDVSSSLFLRSTPGGSDKLSIQVTANGKTAITTTDDVGNEADLVLTVGGYVDINSASGEDITLDSGAGITLDSGDGTFILSNAGTEFSVANSAYAGTILGYTTVGIDATSDSKTLSTSMATVDAAHNVSFIAPPSGVVEIFVSIYCDFSRRTVILGLSDNATYAAIDFPNSADTTNEHLVALPPSASGDRTINHRWVVTGLTAGDTYKWWLGAKSSHSLANTLRWGGVSASGQYAPFIMKATALPAAVTDFAVYG